MRASNCLFGLVFLFFLSGCASPERPDSITYSDVWFEVPEQCEFFSQSCYDGCYAESVRNQPDPPPDQTSDYARCVAGCNASHTNESDIQRCIGTICNRPPVIREIDFEAIASACTEECTSIEPPRCGDCVAQTPSPMTHCTRKVPEGVIVTTEISVSCAAAEQTWQPAGWDCGPCVAQVPLPEELQYRSCSCGDTQFLESCAVLGIQTP